MKKQSRAYDSNFRPVKRQRRQSGAALVLSLIVLAVLTIFAISSINISSTEEVITRNTIGYKVALTGAEATLRDGIEAIVQTGKATECGNLSDTAATCDVDQYYRLDANARDIDLASQSIDYWKTRGVNIQSVSEDQLKLISGTTDRNIIPKRIVTKREIRGSGPLYDGRGGSIVQSLYEVSSIGQDANGKSQVVIRQNLVRNELK